MHVDLELWLDGRWIPAATLEALGDPRSGLEGKVALEYNTDFAADYLQKGGSCTLSCRYPPSFELWTEAPWPAFVLDILPAGAARVSMLRRLGMQDGREADWELLSRAHFAPGNLRVKPPGPTPQPTKHQGFDRSDVIERGEDFVEYAYERGAPVAGSSGAQGDAPKFLLAEDKRGRWHAEGVIADADVSSHWLVKFPRGRHETDLWILEEEARYMELARQAGLRANAALSHEDGCLFVPRFDRRGQEYLGLETIASLCGISAYGQTQPLQASSKAIATFCSDPATELCEFLARDILNIGLGNTDNHLRNTSVLKYPDGTVKLSPMYDLAPMLLDRSMIPRACRWGAREKAGRIDWCGVLDDLAALGVDRSKLLASVQTMAKFISSLAQRMETIGVREELTTRLRKRQEELAADLTKAAQ